MLCSFSLIARRIVHGSIHPQDDLHNGQTILAVLMFEQFRRYQATRAESQLYRAHERCF